MKLATLILMFMVRTFPSAWGVDSFREREACQSIGTTLDTLGERVVLKRAFSESLPSSSRITTAATYECLTPGPLSPQPFPAGNRWQALLSARVGQSLKDLVEVIEEELVHLEEVSEA